MTQKQRITLLMSDEVVVKLRKKQANLITKTQRGVSFSSVVDLYLKKVLRV